MKSTAFTLLFHGYILTQIHATNHHYRTNTNIPSTPITGGAITTQTKRKRPKNLFRFFQQNKEPTAAFFPCSSSSASEYSDVHESITTPLNGTVVVQRLPNNVASVEDSSSTKAAVPDEEYKRAMFRTSITVAAAALFGCGVICTKGVNSGMQFFAGYLIEQSLSIDNLFVFIMLFEYFRIPREYQNRVLSWGVGGAIVLRGVMIGVGVAALQRFKNVILVFAGILIASSINLLMETEDHESTGAGNENFIMKITKVLFPNTTSELHGERFFIKSDVGKHLATPLFLCLVCVELSDFVFAVDSIPAVLGVSKDPLIVYASNIFAIMALRSLYTIVAVAVQSFHYLKPAVALVLGFVGIKMIAEYFHVEIGTGASLLVICSLLGSGVGASLFEKSRREESSNGGLISGNPGYGLPLSNATTIL